MPLQGKNAVIYGATGGAGAAIARSFAEGGWNVFLAGRSRERLEALASELSELGTRVEVAVVDPLNSTAVENHVADIVNEHGTVDVSVNLAFQSVEMGTRLTGLSADEFVSASLIRVRSNFITCTAAARHMAYQGSGVILAVTGADPGTPLGRFAGLAIGGAAIEAFCRQLAGELGPRGVRVVCLQGGSPSDRPALEPVLAALAPPGPPGISSRSGSPRRGPTGTIDRFAPGPSLAMA